jgi:UPF0176 protein
MKTHQTLLYYWYTHLQDAEQFASAHLKFCNSLGLKGRILVADEGINGTVSGSIEACKKYMDALNNNSHFKGIEFKIDEENEVSFSKMHVRYKKEIVHFGVNTDSLWKERGEYLEPGEWMEHMHDEDVIVLDVRNKLEWELGKFKNAVTLDIEHFRELPAHIEELNSFKKKTVFAYCTGGIRCEKATAFLKQNGFENVFHLHGGIINYGKETGGKDFDGKCYVFDKRLSVDVNSVNPMVISKCHLCGKSDTRMVNCANEECNNHFVMCEECGWKYEGCCSEVCRKNPKRRKYDGSGYYSRGTVQKGFSNNF